MKSTTRALSLAVVVGALGCAWVSACGGRTLGGSSDAATRRDSTRGSSSGSGSATKDAAGDAALDAGSDGSAIDGADRHDATARDGSSASWSGSGSSSGSGSGIPCDGGVCRPGAQHCADGLHIETCESTCQWGNPWPCATGTCSGGACTGTTTTAPPSCAPGGSGMTSCGPGGNGNESCCTSLEVPGGTYFRTYVTIYQDGGMGVVVDSGPTGEADPATVSGFRLDKYLVTVGRFRQFVNAVDQTAGLVRCSPAGRRLRQAHAPERGPGAGEQRRCGDGYETGWVATDDSDDRRRRMRTWTC